MSFNHNNLYKEIEHLIINGLRSIDILKQIKISHPTLLKIVNSSNNDKIISKLKNNNRRKKGLIDNKRILYFMYNHLQNVIYFIYNGWTTNRICKEYNISRQTLKKVLMYKQESIVLKRLEQNNKQASKLNGIRNGSKKGETNNTHYSLIKTLLYEGFSSIGIKKYLLQYNNINISHTAIIRVIRDKGKKEDIIKLKENAKNIQSQCVLELIKNKTSIPEQMLRDIILQYFPTAKWKYPIKNNKGFFWEIDIALPEYRIAFEYDCTFWHSVERDAFRDKDLTSLGWKVIRFIYKNNPTIEVLTNDFCNKIKNIPELACKQK